MNPEYPGPGQAFGVPESTEPARPRSATPYPTAGTARGGGYGNIYTPHAGSMIIQVQRESGLQSRTIVLSPRQIRILRFIMSRSGKLIAAGAAALVALLVVEAARVPALTGRIARMEHTAQRLDTLERSLSELQKRYDQVRTMMGGDAPADAEHAASAAPGFVPAPAIQTRAPGHSAVRATVRAAATDIPSDAAEPADAASGDASADSGAGAAASAAAGSATGTATAAASAGHRPRARRSTSTPAPQPVVVPPPPDSGTPPSPQAEPQ